MKNNLIKTQVEIVDLETHIVTSIPAVELAPGMISITCGDHMRWADAQQVQAHMTQKRAAVSATSIVHSPRRDKRNSVAKVGKLILPKPLCESIHGIKLLLAEVSPKSFVEWKAYFQEQGVPERAIAAWAAIADTYTHVGEWHLLDEQPLEQKRQLLHLLLVCCCMDSSDPEHAKLVIDRRSRRSDPESNDRYNPPSF